MARLPPDFVAVYSTHFIGGNNRRHETKNAERLLSRSNPETESHLSLYTKMSCVMSLVLVFFFSLSFSSISCTRTMRYGDCSLYFLRTPVRLSNFFNQHVDIIPSPLALSGVSQEERLVHGKLEGLAYQYNTLLTSQLDEQRHFYQKRVSLRVGGYLVVIMPTKTLVEELLNNRFCSFACLHFAFLQVSHGYSFLF